MAHQCPVCGCKCTCGGDIDDLVLHDEWSETMCTCCAEPESFTDDDDAVDIYREAGR